MPRAAVAITASRPSSRAPHANGPTKRAADGAAATLCGAAAVLCGAAASLAAPLRYCAAPLRHLRRLCGMCAAPLRHLRVRVRRRCSTCAAAAALCDAAAALAAPLREAWRTGAETRLAGPEFLRSLISVSGVCGAAA